MRWNLNRRLGLNLIGIGWLLGGSARPVGAAPPLMIDQLTFSVQGDPLRITEPGERLQIQFRLSQTASATLTLDDPQGVLAFFVNLTLQGGFTYCTEFVPTTRGVYAFRLEATDGTSTDVATRLYVVGRDVPLPERLTRIELLTTSQGCGMGNFTVGEAARVFFRVDDGAQGTLTVEKADHSFGQLLFENYPLRGGETYHVDYRPEIPGEYIARFVARSHTPVERMCTFTVLPTSPPDDTVPPASSAFGRSMRLSASAGPPGADTGIDVLPGQRISVDASGLATYGYDTAPHDPGFWQTGPSGQRHLAGGRCWLRADPRAVLPTAPIGMLIGRIGNGPWFALGSKGEWTVRESGRLYLLYNDGLDAYGDNSGEYVVEITVTSS